MRTIEKTVYRFVELSDSAKAKVREQYREWACQDNHWYEYIFDDAKEIGKILGIKIDNIYFSGFSCQGDGACLTGSYSYAKSAAKAIRAHAPLDTELHRIASELQSLQRENFYKLTASIRHRGRYYHSLYTEITVFNGENSASRETEDDLAEILRDFMNWIYRQLEREYEYCISDEAIEEEIHVNANEFDENGNAV